MIFFTADLHLYHKRLFDPEFEHNRLGSFSSLEEMNDALINNWKAKVLPSDTVYILGDFALGDPQIANRILTSLPGKKMLLMGNHDVRSNRGKRKKRKLPEVIGNLKYDINCFESVFDGGQTISLEYDGYTFDMNHKLPAITENTRPQNHIYLYAHNHVTALTNQINMALHIPAYNVGVDANDFAPISITELFDIMRKWTKEPNIVCPNCGKPMKVIIGKYGRFLGCIDYPHCDARWYGIYGYFS